MQKFVIIQQKLEEFIKKYYINELIKGGILFVGISLFYAIIVLGLEYFLWLSSIARSILFWSFILVQVMLLAKYVVVPLSKLFKLSKGLNYLEASKIIGNHFPEVKDKLLNVIQLKENPVQSELLIASIEQKIVELQPVPFKTAISFNTNIKYAKFAVIPIFIVLVVLFSGHGNIFSESFERVKNYDVAYQPPAPFSFVLLNNDLKVQENKALNIVVEVKGNIIPETASIEFNNQSYFLKQISPGRFQYTFEKVEKPTKFRLKANGIYSLPYEIEVIKVPKMRNFEMDLNFPSYTQKKNKKVKGSGNAIVPEGTKITWNIATQETKEISFIVKDSVQVFGNNNADFHFQKSAFASFPYQISTSNEEVRNHEKLSYNIKVIKDEFPKLLLDYKKDSINRNTYFKGQATDDYAVSSVKLVFYNINNPEKKQALLVDRPKAALAEFVYAFPGNIELKASESYQYYFEVFDNDEVNGSKSVKSKIFDFRKPSEEEIKDEKLQNQKESISGMDKSIQEMERTEKQLNDLNKLQKEKSKLDYNDRRKLKEFLERQKKQEALMKQHQEKLKRNLEDAKEDDFKEELERRLDNNEKRLQENEKLRKELEKYTEKINKEELGKKLEEMSKQNKIQQKSLEQLLELTKRYYIQEKQQKLNEELKQLAQEQEEMSEKSDEENTPEQQEKLNEKFEEFQEEMKELMQENEKLQKPIDIPEDSKKQEEVSQEQEKAKEKLNNQDKSGAKEHQKKAAKKMKEMQQKMANEMQMQGGEAMVEDAAMLRQVLDNLVRFSFEQEFLLENFRSIQNRDPQFSKLLRSQNRLKEHFKHVDDSLYALALRNPMVTEEVLENLTEVEYNMDKALERFAENEIPQGISSQQYVITISNDLALMLDKLLSSMQEMLSGSGTGKSGGKGFQLPDVIQKQGKLGEKMEQGMQKGKKGKTGEGEKGKEGESPKSGKSESGQSGKDGKNGEQGEGGEGKSQGQGDSNEEMSGEIYEIYQQQQQLRQQLEDKMRESGFTKEEDRLLKQMEEVEQDLLHKGFNEETLRKMMNLKHELLKLDRAALRQGKEQKRESETNNKDYVPNTKDPILKAKEYFNTTEILNRQVLPLRQIYKIKVQEYFNVGNY